MFKILKKELKAFFKDRRAVMLTFVIPTVLISVFALAFGSGNGKDSINKIPILVSDDDKTEITKQTISELDSVKLLEVIPCNYDSGLNLVKTGKKAAILEFHKGFSDSANALKSLPWELDYDAAQAQEMGILQQLLSRALYSKVSRMMGEKKALNNMDKQYPGMDSNSRKFVANKIKENFSSGGSDESQQNTMKLNTVSVVSEELTDPGLVQAVAGTAVMMLLFALTGMGGTLLDEKEHGTLKRLLYSPVHPAEILLGKMFSSIIVAIFQLTIMFTYASLVFGLKVHDKILPLALIIFATAFACSGFGIFLATIAKSRSQLQGISTLIVLSMSVLGGSMVPTVFMPQWMQNMSHFTLNYWSIQGFYDVLWRQLPIGGALLTKVGVLLMIGMSLMLLAFRFFRKNVLAIA